MSRIDRQALTLRRRTQVILGRPSRAVLLLARAAALACVVLSGTALLAASALAAAPIALDAPNNGSQPLIAYDPTTQTTYVAWADPHNPGVDLCILPAGATTCLGGAAVLLEDNKYPGYSKINRPELGGLVVLPGGEAVVVGTPVSEGSIAWASPAGGAAFLAGGQGLQNGGNFISPVSLFYTFGNAVALSSGELALLDDSDHFFSNFSDSSLTAESPALPPSGNSNSGGQYPGKAQFTDGPEVAAEPAPAPAPAGTEIVVGVGANESAAEKTPTGCLNYADSGYGVSAGTLSGTSKEAGTLNGEGLPPYQLLACSADAPVLAQGGTDGIGVLEQEGSGVSGAGSEFTLDFRPFNATATGGAFGAPVELSNVTGQTLNGVNTLDLVDDSGAGVYATWTDEQGLVLDYSANGGASWGGPTVVPAPASGSQSNPVIAGVGGGVTEIAYESNPGTGTQVFLEPVSYAELTAPAPDTLTTVQTAGAQSGASLTVPAGTVGETDRATITGAKASSATGTVTYKLYSSSSCAAPSQVFSSAAAVSAGVVAPSAAVSAALASGSYYWQAFYSGNATNAPSTSACGSEVLTISAPDSGFTVKSISESFKGTITITLVPVQAGLASLVVTVPTASIASTSAVVAKSKKCKHGQVKVKGKCLPAKTLAGKTSGHGTAGVPLKLTVNLSSKVKALLKKGKRVHLTATVTYTSSFGGKPTVHTYSVTVKGPKPKK